MINKVFIIGNLGRDPEKKFTQDGTAVTTFSIATTEKWTGKGASGQQEHTEWHRVVTFRRLAEICGEYLHKGSKVYIEGSLRTRSWDKEGITRYTTEIEAREMKMLDSGKPDGVRHDDGNHGSSKDSPDNIFDDVPFHLDSPKDPPF